MDNIFLHLILPALFILAVVAIWSGHRDVMRLKRERLAAELEAKKAAQEPSESVKAVAELKSDITQLQKLLAELRDELNSVKVSMGWSQND